MSEEKKPLQIFHGLTEPSEDMASLEGGLSDAAFGRMVEKWEEFDPLGRKAHAIAARIRAEK